MKVRSRNIKEIRAQGAVQIIVPLIFPPLLSIDAELMHPSDTTSMADQDPA
jgi:hypothetical protein